MIEITVLFLMTSLIFYTTFGGADFGAGILEIFTPKEKRKEVRTAINHAIGPVWEANHVWIILAIVILFIAFPKAYQIISIYFYIPLNIMLLGIVFRGCAFIFRYYDPFEDASHRTYSIVFALASFITPLAEGIIAGGLIAGSLDLDSSNSMIAYILPWMGMFPFSVGFFLCSLCILNASCLLLAEHHDNNLRSFFEGRARICAAITLVLGGVVFLSAHFAKLPLPTLYFNDALSLGCNLVGLGILFSLIIFLKRLPKFAIRAMSVSLITVILVGWWKIQFPYLVGFSSGTAHALNIYEAAAPEAVLKNLLISLSAGVILIFPPLIFLLHTFKAKPSY